MAWRPTALTNVRDATGTEGTPPSLVIEATPKEEGEGSKVLERG
jgi:hypothetical protein